MAQNPYTITRPVPRDPADEYVHDRLFSVDRRHNALDIDPGANNYVRTVTDDSPWASVIEQAGADLLGPQYPQARAAYVRGALRPSMRGAGRDRWR